MQTIQPPLDDALPAAKCLVKGADGWALHGVKCTECGAVYVEEARHTCASCHARNCLETTTLSQTGKLYSFSIVHRSFPGIDVPYISAIVDLDGGGTIKGNIIEVEPEPENLPFNLPLQIVFGDALGRKDKDGNAYCSYFFKPL